MFPARLLQLLRVSILGAAIALVQLPAWAAPEAAEFRLTPELLRKVEAIDAESKRLALAEEDDQEEADDEADADDEDDADDETVEGLARKMESVPEVKALLARHGVTPIQFALSAHALLHAGMYLAFEEAMDKQKAAELLRGYTKAQRDNIELVRKSGLMKKN